MTMSTQNQRPSMGMLAVVKAIAASSAQCEQYDSSRTSQPSPHILQYHRSTDRRGVNLDKVGKRKKAQKGCLLLRQSLPGTTLPQDLFAGAVCCLLLEGKLSEMIWMISEVVGLLSGSSAWQLCMRSAMACGHCSGTLQGTTCCCLQSAHAPKGCQAVAHIS